MWKPGENHFHDVIHQWKSSVRSAFLPWDNSNVGTCPNLPPHARCLVPRLIICCAFFVWHTPAWNMVMEKSYTWGHSTNHSGFTAEEFGCQPTSDSRKSENFENQLDSTQNSSWAEPNLHSPNLPLFRVEVGLRLTNKTVATSVYQFCHWDCTANNWELRGLNLQFNIHPRLAIFSKRTTIHITGFLREVFESAAADKWPEVTRQMTRRITWSWSKISQCSCHVMPNTHATRCSCTCIHGCTCTYYVNMLCDLAIIYAYTITYWASRDDYTAISQLLKTPGENGLA